MSTAFQFVCLAGAYAAMVASQNYGSSIVGLFHGPAAKLEAEAIPEDVAPGTPLLELCMGYAHHHFDSISNSWHAGGMTAGLISVAIGLWGGQLTKWQRLASLLWWAPQWYLWAWLGHFWLQKDVPAVFTYGLTPKSYLTGEFCSTMWVYTGSVFSSKNSTFPGFPGAGPVPSAYLFFQAIVQLALIGAFSPPGLLWQKALARSPKAVKAKAL